MLQHIVIYDTEYLAVEGSNKRNSKGMDDPRPIVVQIAAVRIRISTRGSSTNLEKVGELCILTKPRDEYGDGILLDPYFTNLTGITQEDVDVRGLELSDALCMFKQFSGDCLIYSYGRDHLSTLLPSCYMAGVALPFSPRQFRDVRHVFRRAGVSDEVIYENSSGTIARALGAHFEGKVHDAMSDAMSIFVALQLLCRRGSLNYEWLLE